MSIADNPFIAPLARRADPATSHAAACGAYGLLADHQQAILDVLMAHGPLGKDGIARHTFIDGVAVCRRLKQMQREGKIAPTGRTVKSDAGRAEREWRQTVATKWTA